MNNKLSLIFYLFAIVATTSCNQAEVKSKPPVARKPQKTYTAKTINSSVANNVIDFPCAVIIEPDDKTIDHLKKINSEDDYNTIVDDNEFYISESTTFLDSVKLKEIQKYSKGSVVFKTAAGGIYSLKLDSIPWGVILFNGNNKPVKVDITDIEDSYHSYMK